MFMRVKKNRENASRMTVESSNANMILGFNGTCILIRNPHARIAFYCGDQSFRFAVFQAGVASSHGHLTWFSAIPVFSSSLRFLAS